CGICGTDIHIVDGEFAPTPYPIIPGHEFCGTVAGLGAGVEDLAVGERVAADPNIFCHTCDYCRREMHNQCLNLRAVGVNTDGAFAEYVLAPRDVVYQIGDLPFEQGAFIEPLSCVIYGMQRARPRLGDDVLLFGAGPMGCLLAQMLWHSGAARLVVVDRVPERLALARTLGATHTVLADENQDRALRALAPRGYDFCIDATGVPAVVERAFDYLAPRGTMFVFGVCPADAQVRVSPYQVFRNDWRVIGSFATCYTFQEAIRLLRGGVVQVEPLISHRLPLSEAARAFTAIQDDPRRMKVLIRP
ncbi:MAG: zinc-dependent alcohol dehydrogenase family protein, partial [Anaerolineae bacterium]|nr:zinc-dependent alcohol dehydrogenase family protein [Anaerolineae bacterium]